MDCAPSLASIFSFFFELLLVWRGVAVACMTRHGRGIHSALARHVALSRGLDVNHVSCATLPTSLQYPDLDTVQNEMESRTCLFLLSHTHLHKRTSRFIVI
ncbi:hypothetical protein V8E52_001883 [Russula decolorans]|jgi:hypothetical protein